MLNQKSGMISSLALLQTVTITNMLSATTIHIPTNKYFIYDFNKFEEVNEVEYSKWHSEEWKKYEPEFFSKFIGEILYTVQTFYNGNLLESSFKPFTIFYMEGSKHRIRHYNRWSAFKTKYEKLIAQLTEKESVQ